ncbi:MAG TPA: RNA-binding S4 domain-containing protein [Thermoanaerobaculia bacterium]|nr:RNA-binding S4 domain-containing protein [Thermoanaerobaculia bacterium]
MSVRLDKWLNVARMFKTRTQATHACELGRVQVNGQMAKAHRHLAPGDRIELTQGDWDRILIVKELRDRPVPKAEAALLYEDQSPPRPAQDPFSRILRQAPARRDPGAGRPTKKERREMEKWEEGTDGPDEQAVEDDVWD